MDQKTIFGIFKSAAQLDSAIFQLKTQGFSREDISIVMPRGDHGQYIAHENQTKAPEGATIGATSGLVLGGALGWLVGAGILAVTGLGPLIAAGPLLAALAGASVAGTLGGIGGALVGMGIPEYEAKNYEDAVKGGGTLIAVVTQTDAEEDRAKKILEDYGATDISSSSAEKLVMNRPNATPDYTSNPPPYP